MPAPTAAPVPASTPATCGIVMPISSLDGCTVEHWLDVRRILTEAVESVPSPKFATRLVSDAEDVGIIQKRIIQSLYDSDIVVCDVSGKNPNVMFELGMRLAFDKPVVIVKDDKTDYSFDTGIIEHLIYPRDLRFARIVEFKDQLADKVAATHKKYPKGTKSSPFLGGFGSFEVATIDHKQVSPDRLVVLAIEELRAEMRLLRRRIDHDRQPAREVPRGEAVQRRIINAILLLASGEPDGLGPHLLADPEFISRLENEVKPDLYFKSPDEFRGTVETILRSLGHVRKA